MGNVKTVVTLMGVCLVVILAMAFGLSKVGDKTQVVKVDMAKLVDGARFIKGDEKAKVTVVEFSDVQCPACKDAQPVALELQQMSGVRFVYRDFPLIMVHKNAWKGARAVEAGRLMGKGFEMLDLMFQKQGEWAESAKFEELVVGYAKSLGLDENEFKTKWNSDETDKLVKVDSDLAGELKLQGTPTFFVDGEQVAVNFVVGKVKDLLKQ